MSGMRISHDTYSQVFGTVYVALMTNLLIVLACLPFVVGLLVTDPVMINAYSALYCPTNDFRPSWIVHRSGLRR